ncbi:unnamed protein product [Discula destructiva]
MAPTTATPIPPPVIPPHPKPKRPVPAGIQTNGLAASSSPSPSMSAKKPPNSAKQSVKAAAAAAAAANNNNSSGGTVTVARPNNHIRSEITALPNGHARSSISAASAPPPAPSSAIEPAAVPVVPEQPPTKDYILKKFVGNPPSLVVHLHLSHFKFDNQDDYFPYTSPMKSFLEHLNARTIPHDMMTEFTEGEVPFYEGCLIVEVHNHRIAAVEEKEEARPSSRSKDDVPNSIHKYNRFITPSPNRPFPKDVAAAAKGHAKKSDAAQQGNRAGSTEQGSSSASDSPQSQKKKAPPMVRIQTIVLFPTQQSRHADIALRACNPRASVDNGVTNGVPPTPSVAVPPTPTGSSMPPPAKKVKREHMELDSGNIYEVEGKMLLGSLPPLDLEPTRNAIGTIVKLEEQAEACKHRFHPAPLPKTRKRTVAEMAADEAQAAGKERYLLVLDERNGQGGSSMPGGDGQQQAKPFDPTFERFKKIEEIKREHLERAQQEKLKQAENERALQERKLQQQQQAAQAQLQQQQVAAMEERNRQEQDAHRAQVQAQQQQELLRRRQLQQQQQQQAQQAQQAQRQALAMGQTSHGHPMANGAANGIPVSLSVSAPMSIANGRLQGAVSQPAASSPLVRQNTPLNMSSPMVGSAAMQASGSSIGAGSPARPPSVVNQQPMSAPMTGSMSARGSQQSHPSGTPRMPHVTPNMAHATPTSRAQMANTPRMSQASPPPNMTAPQMQHIMMNNPGMAHMASPSHNAQHYAQMMAQQQRNIQAANMMGNGGINVTPQQQQQQQMQQRMVLAAQQQNQQQQRIKAALLQQNPHLATNPQTLQQHVSHQWMLQQQQQQQHARALAQQQAQGGVSQSMGNAGGVSYPNQHTAAMQQLAAQQRAQQQQQQQQQQHMASQQGMGQVGQQPNQANQQHMGAQGPQMMGGQVAPQTVQSIIAPHFQRLYSSMLPQFLQSRGVQSPDACPPHELEAFKQKCIAQAKNTVMRQMAMSRQQNPQQMSPQQQQHQQQQLLYQQNMIRIQRQQQEQQQQQQQQHNMQGL